MQAQRNNLGVLVSALMLPSSQYNGSLPRILKVFAGYTDRRIAHINSEVVYSVHDFRNDLSGARSTPNDGDFLSRQVIVVTPMGGMPRNALEFITASCCPKFRSIQGPNTLAYKICQPLLRFTGGFVLDGETPFENLVVPKARPHETVELCAFLQLILACKFCIVLFNLLFRSKEVCPFCFPC